MPTPHAPRDAKIKLTKMDAACRQLRTAIRLWFGDGDPVSIHALAFAAHEIIHRLYKLRGLSDLLFDSDMIKDEYRGDWAKLLKKHGGFFKHADRDPEAETTFDPFTNEMFITVSVVALSRMGITAAPEESAFSLWLFTQHPDWFTKEKGERTVPIKLLENVRNVEKSKFFEAYLLNMRKPSGRIRVYPAPVEEMTGGEVNPLEAWLRSVREKKKDFLARTGIPRATLFDLLRGADKDFGMRTLTKIENATGGEVTIKMLRDWLNRNRT
jgi:hypothetical protein